MSSQVVVAMLVLSCLQFLRPAVANPLSCPPLKSQTVRISCVFGQEERDCGETQRPGTFARLQCKPGYFIPKIPYRKTSCLESGQWSRPLFNCFPDCGRWRTNSGAALISGGQTATVGEFPWHVGIYRAVGSSYVLECGGSLIRANVVLSVAHCFWDDGLRQHTNVSHYRVAAGKLIRAWEDPDPLVQRREVLRVDTNEFNGRLRNFGFDIALVFLNDPVEITDNVNLVCVDWDGVGRQQLQAGGRGVVPGWGFTENDTQSDDLKFLELPYVPLHTCFEGLTDVQQPLLTTDKFCAGFENENKSVCPGDSGGGLVFLDQASSKYVIRGVTSINFKPANFNGKCYANKYTAFTLVSAYIDWMQRRM